MAEPSQSAVSLVDLKFVRGIAPRHGVRDVRVFGSIVAGTATSESDVDLLVGMEPGRSLLDLVGFSQDVEERLGRRVDVVTEDALSPHLRDRILREAVPP